jgi:hypothetical protein
MNDRIRKRVRIEHSKKRPTGAVEITRYGGYERDRDTRPGRFAVTGDFIKLPQSDEQQSADAR